VSIYGSGNHDLLQDVINEQGHTNRRFVLMGDFNYRYLQWPPSGDNSITDEAAQFYQTLEVNFFTQHVECCTRADAILDLVITDEPNMVNEVVDFGPFTGSDHNALFWKVEVRTKTESVSRQIFDYGKADIESMKRELKSVDWENILGNLSAEDSWNLFKMKIETLEQRFIPVKSLSARTHKPVWMTHAAYRAVCHRRQVYRRCKNTSHPAYIRAATRAKVLVNNAMRFFEEKLAKNIKEDRKSFFCICQK